jgi:hypothetical protein
MLLLVRHPARVRIWLEVGHPVYTEAAAITAIWLVLLGVRKLLCCQEEQLRRKGRPLAGQLQVPHCCMHRVGQQVTQTIKQRVRPQTCSYSDYKTAAGQPTAIAEGRAQATPERSCMTPRSKEGGAVG